MSRVMAVRRVAIPAGVTVSGPFSGYPTIAALRPLGTSEGSKGSGLPMGADVRSNARSSWGSKTTGVAEYKEPSTRTCGWDSPAMTCALVTITPGFTSNAVPSWVTPQAPPTTFTVEVRAPAAIDSASIAVGTATGEDSCGGSWAKTGGTPSWLRNAWTWAKTDGTGGITSSTVRSTSDREMAAPSHV